MSHLLKEQNKENCEQWRFHGIGLAYRKHVGERNPVSEGGLHAAAGMGEGGNVICEGQEVRREVLTHFLFLLLG